MFFFNKRRAERFARGLRRGLQVDFLLSQCFFFLERGFSCCLKNKDEGAQKECEQSAVTLSHTVECVLVFSAC